MKTVIVTSIMKLLFHLVFIAVFATSVSADKEPRYNVHRWVVDLGPENFRKSVRKEITTGKVMVSLLNGDVLAEVIHDEKAKRFFFAFSDNYGEFEVTKNGKEINLNQEEKIAIFASFKEDLDPNFKTSKKPNYLLGIWVPMELVDRISITAKQKSVKAENSYSISYDPDHGWHGSIEKPIANNPVKKADAYYFTHRSLLQDIRDVLAKKEKCVVKLPRNSFVAISRFKKVEQELMPMRIQVMDKVFLFSYDENGEIFNKEEVPDYEARFDAYAGAARAGGIQPILVIHTNDLTKDDQLIKVLQATQRTGIDRIMLHHTKAKGVKKVLEQAR